jgi:hypothetical protein
MNSFPLLLLLLCVKCAFSGPFRSTSLSWYRDSVVDPLTITLRYELAWLYDESWVTGNNLENSAIEINWGDGSAVSDHSAPLIGQTGTSPSLDTLIAYVEFVHTYDEHDMYQIGFASCCRDVALSDSNDGASYKVFTQFNSSTDIESSPVISMPFIIGWTAGEGQKRFTFPVQADYPIAYSFTQASLSSLSVVLPTGSSLTNGGRTLVWSPSDEGVYAVQLRYSVVGIPTIFSVSDFTIMVSRSELKVNIPIILSHNATVTSHSFNYTVSKGETFRFRIRTWSLNATEHTQWIMSHWPTGVIVTPSCEEGLHPIRPPLSVGSNCTRTIYWKVPDTIATRAQLFTIVAMNTDHRVSMPLQFYVNVTENTHIIHPVVPTQSLSYDFNTVFKDMFVNAQTLDVDLVVDTAPHWDTQDPWSIMLRLGEGGYPTSDIDLDSTTISERVSPPTKFPSYPSWQVYFEDEVSTNNDFSTLNTSQDAYDTLNPSGICTYVDYVYDSDTDRNVIRWSVAFNLIDITAAYNHTICVDVPALDRTDCSVPISAVYRNSAGASTFTPVTLNIIIYNTGLVTGVIVGAITYPFSATLNGIASTSSGCENEEEDTRLRVTYRLQYTNVEDGAMVGPMSVGDIIAHENCYELEVYNIVTPECVLGVCISYVTIQTECRTPTSDGLAFQICSESSNATIGDMSVGIKAKHCTIEDSVCIPLTVNGVSDTLYAILLVSVTSPDSVDLHYDMFLRLLDSINDTLTMAITQGPHASSDDSEPSLITVLSEWFTPCIFLDTTQSRQIFNLEIRLENITIWGLDSDLSITSGPFGWDSIQPVTTMDPKAETDASPVVCEGVPGCDGFALSFSDLADMTGTSRFRLSLFAVFTPLVPSSSQSNRRLMGTNTVVIGSGFHTIDIRISNNKSTTSTPSIVFLLIVWVMIPAILLAFVAIALTFIPPVNHVPNKSSYSLVGRSQKS